MRFSLLEKIFYVLYHIIWFLSVTQCEYIYVSNKATKVSKDCGTEDAPCSTINAAVQIAKKNSEITIMSSNVAYKECPIYVDKPLAFNGIHGNAVIDCGGEDAFIFTFDAKPKAKEKTKKQLVISVKLDVSNLKIQNSKTGFSFLKPTSNVNLRLENIEFVNNDIDVSWSNSRLCYLAMKNVKASGDSGNAIDIKGCNKTTVQLSNTKFVGKYFRVISTAKSYILDINMDGVVFDMSNRANKIRSTDSDKEIQLHSPMYIVTALEKTSITITASKFSNHFGEKNSMINITAFQKRLKLNNATKKILISRININFNDTIFGNNTVRNGGGGAISFNLENELTQKIKHMIIFNASTFIGNSASSGGALWFSAWEKKVVFFNGSTFIDNKALGKEDDGLGGALFGLGGKFLIQFCKFDGNTATKAGGTVYLSKEGFTIMKVSDSVFQNKRSWSSIEGSVMYLNDVQAFFIGKVVFNLSSGNSGESIFLYEGRPSVLRVSNTSVFICPQGYNYEEPKYVLKLKSNKQQKYFPVYHIFAFTCKPCQDLFYSTVRGFRQANETETRGKCHVCPYGASCNGTIRARANFWGMVEGDGVKMTPCPKGYCCDHEPCESYDSCRAHRTGTLCGHCSDGYTESMSSTKCFPKEKCHKAWWLWPVANVIAIFWILCFHQEIINKLVKWSLWTDNDDDEVEEYRRRERNHNERNSEPAESNSLLSDNPTELSNSVTTSIQLIPNGPDPTRIVQSSDYNNSGGYIKVFYYFYQAIFLIRLSSYVSSSSSPNKIIDLLTPLLNFQFTNLWSCTGENWRPVTKVFVKNSVAYWVLGLSFLTYGLYRIVRKRTGITTDDEPGFQARSFPVRLTGTVMHVILLSYVAQTQFTVQILNCIEIGDHDVLYIDGSVRCIRSYQIIVWLHFALSIVAFPFALLFGQNFLISGRISCKEFIVACFIPSFFLCRWGYKYFKDHKGHQTWPQTRKHRDPFKDKVEYILRYPYKSSDSRTNPSITERCRENWEVVLMLRRLILVLVFIFVKSFLLRAYLFFIASMLFLLAHVFVQPFVNEHVNKLDNVSLAVIVLISGLSISEATYNNSGQLIPYDVKLLQILQDWFLALIPFLLVCIFLYPRATFHFHKWIIGRRGSPVPAEDTVECNPSNVQLEELPTESSPLRI